MSQGMGVQRLWLLKEVALDKYDCLRCRRVSLCEEVMVPCSEVGGACPHVMVQAGRTRDEG